MIFNKRHANRILIFSLAGFGFFFILSLVLKDNVMVEGSLFVFEAALVGGIADWFATEALFRNPKIGRFSIPFTKGHTAVIPRNRKDAIRSIASFVKNDILTIEFLKTKTHGLDMAEIILGLVEKNRKEEIAILISKHFLELIKKIDPKKAAISLNLLIKRLLGKMQFTPTFQKLLTSRLENGDINKILDYLVDEGISYVKSASMKEAIKKDINEKINKKVNKVFRIIGEGLNIVNPEDAAQALQEEISYALTSLKNPNNEVRKEIKRLIEGFSSELERNYSLRNAIEAWKNGAVERVDLVDVLTDLITNIIQSIERDTFNEKGNIMGAVIEFFSPNGTSSDGEILKNWLRNQVNKYYEVLRTSPQIKNQINEYVSEFANHFIETKHNLIEDIIVDILEDFSDDELNNLIYKRVGNDLEGIRVNGSFVGAVFGLVVFVVVNSIY